jgi:hypothetical protein
MDKGRRVPRKRHWVNYKAWNKPEKAEEWREKLPETEAARE